MYIIHHLACRSRLRHHRCNRDYMFLGYSFHAMKRATFLIISCLVSSNVLAAQSSDPQLLAAINKIKAIDNHSHPPRLVSPGEKDDDFDALPCDPLEPSDPTTINRPENPQ